MKNWLIKFFKGFDYAGQGIALAFHERNMKVHAVAFILVVGAGLFFKLHTWEWVAIFLVSGGVMSAEIFNTAVEDISNTMRDKLHVSYEFCKCARDLAAGAVLVMAITAVAVAGLIFGPRLLVSF